MELAYISYKKIKQICLIEKIERDNLAFADTVYYEGLDELLQKGLEKGKEE